MEIETLAAIPVRHLPPGIEHLEAATEAAMVARLAQGIRAGEYHPMTRLYPTPSGGVYCRIKRHRAEPEPAPRWIRPALIAAGLALTGAGVAYAVRTATSAVTQAGPALGFLVALSLVLLAVAALRRRSGHTVEVVTRTRVRVK